MTRGIKTGIATVTVLLYLVVANDRGAEGRARSARPTLEPANAQTSGATPVGSQRALIDQYCLGCHSDRVRSGGLALSELNLDAVNQNAEIAEKVIRKLRGGLMPPADFARIAGDKFNEQSVLH